MDMGRIDSVEWHFFESPVTGKSGASGPLKEKLKENGIKYVEHSINVCMIKSNHAHINNHVKRMVGFILFEIDKISNKMVIH